MQMQQHSGTVKLLIAQAAIVPWYIPPFSYPCVHSTNLQAVSLIKHSVRMGNYTPAVTDRTSNCACIVGQYLHLAILHSHTSDPHVFPLQVASGAGVLHLQHPT